MKQTSDETQKTKLTGEKEAADYLGVSTALLQRDRWRKGDIPYVRIGKGAIRYDFDQLDLYILEKSNQKNRGEK